MEIVRVRPTHELVVGFDGPGHLKAYLLPSQFLGFSLHGDLVISTVYGVDEVTGRCIHPGILLDDTFC